MCSLGLALPLTAVGYVSECGRERMVGLSVQLAFTPQPYSTPGLPRILILLASSPRASSSLRRASSSLSLFARRSRYVPAIERNESHVWF